MKSELEKYRDLVKVGDNVIYVDSENSMLYQVTEKSNKGIEIEALNDNCNVPKGEREYVIFNELQIGWYLTKETKINNKINL